MREKHFMTALGIRAEKEWYMKIVRLRGEIIRLIENNNITSTNIIINAMTDIIVKYSLDSNMCIESVMQSISVTHKQWVDREKYECN